jgi:RNA polymerase sigma factor (sigma-70 family)
MTEQTEKEIINGCLRGETAAQEKLYKQYYTTLLKICARYVENMSDAEILLNDSYYKAFQHLSTYQFKGSFEGWLKRITVNTCVDYIRSKEFQKGRKTIEIKEFSLNHSVQPEDDFIGKLEFHSLLKMIQELPNNMKAVFNLYVFEEYSHKQIGEELRMTENNSQWHLHQARKMLREKIMQRNKIMQSI